MRMNNVSFSTYGRLEMRNREISSIAKGINKVYYVNEGSLQGTEDGKTYTMKKGHLYLIPQNFNLSFSTEYVDHTFIDFYCTPGIVMDTVLDIEISEYPLIESVFATLNYLVARYPMWEMDREFIFHETVKSTLINLISLIDKEFEISTVTDEIICKAVEYIHENYGECLSVTGLAGKFHIDKSSFIRKFKRYTNITPYQYIKSLRINTALELRRTGKYTLDEIAEMVGYSDASTLSHLIAKIEPKEQI